MKKFNDDTLLARWLNNELTPEEKADFESSEDYLTYEKIKAGSDQFESPSNYDTEKMLEFVLESRHDSSNQNRRTWIFAAAASIAMVLVSYVTFLQLSEVSYSAANSEKNTVELPDGSTVILNAGSEISHNRWNWSNARIIELEGEAFFDVSKGSTFRVETSVGSVTVLGTEFNVKVSGGFFEVVCYEGRVSVRTGSDSLILHASDGFRKIQSQSTPITSSRSEPAWMNNESNFNNVPAEYVIEELEKQYDLAFKGQLTPGMMFTGSFPHDDRKVALKIVLDALQIDYQVKGNVVELQN